MNINNLIDYADDMIFIDDERISIKNICFIRTIVPCTWFEAVSEISRINENESIPFNDWRIPTAKEIKNIESILCSYKEKVYNKFFWIRIKTDGIFDDCCVYSPGLKYFIYKVDSMNWNYVVAVR